ncbi:MAG: lysophospholipid acyltransferase family protein [Candidatus Thiodiazotropha sp. (ex Epidulcina cf. delphinae)]|nr:lysophospholipid acyltransferase family protein [Candidatus Thiodiazotropha sp. (ex Epidulcina cf. delphinae)]
MPFRFAFKLWRLLGHLPLAWLHALGRFIGRLHIWFPNRERRIAGINLRLCYPELAGEDITILRDRAIEQMGCTLMEMAAIWFRPVSEVVGLVRKISGEEQLERADGQGLIILLPHLGCWEIIGLELPRHEQVTSLYRPPRKRAYEAVVRRARERSGAELVPTDHSGVKRIYQALMNGGVTCILPDQQPKSDKGAVFAPFFDIPALTMLLVNRLARKTGAKVVFAYAERLAGGKGYHIHYLGAPKAIADEDPLKAATALNRGVESLVRLLPTQYQWSYKRLHAQPGGEASPYRFKRNLPENARKS